MDKTLKILLRATLFLIPIIFSALYSHFELIDDFAFSNAALSTIWGRYGRVEASPFKVSSGFFEHNINMHSFRPFAPIFVLTYSLISGIKIDEVILLPISGLFITLTFYALLRRLSIPEPLTFFMISVGIIINNGVVMTAAFYYISMGYALAFLFVYLILKLIGQDNLSTRSTILISILFCIIAPWFYYTFAFMLIVILLSFIVQGQVLKIRLNSRRGMIINLLLISVIAFASEQTIYYYAKISNLNLLLTAIQDWTKSAISLFSTGSYHSYKPVFIHYGQEVDIINRLFLWTLAALTVLIISLVKIYVKIPIMNIIIGNNRENLLLGAFLMLAIAHIIVYFATYEINYALMWIYLSIFIAYWSEKLLQNYHTCKILKILLLSLISLVLIFGYTMQAIFIIDNIYSDFFTKRNAVTSFITSSLLSVKDYTKIYVIHHTYAYITYKRVTFPNYDYSNTKFYLITPQLNYDDIRLANNDAPLVYIHHKDIPYVRVGTIGIIKNIFSEIIANNKTRANIIFNDGYNEVYFFWPNSTVDVTEP